MDNMLINMKKSFLPLILLIFLSSTVKAQNIVPDPSFEDWTPGASTFFDQLGELNFWESVNGTCDYHHQQHTSGVNLEMLEDCPLGNGNLNCGVPVEGEAVVGFWKENSEFGSKEWAAAQLLEPMVAGNCYILSFWIQNKKDNPDFLMETSNWGMFFSSTDEPAFDPNTLDFDLVSNQFVMMDEMLDSNDWRYVEWNYTADYAYEYIYLGYMGNVSDATENIWSSSGSIGPYIWMDVVSVIPLDSVILVAQDDIQLCDTASTYITASCNVNYQWTWDNGTMNSSDSILFVDPDVTTTYYCYAGDFADCAVIDSVTVEIIVCCPDIQSTFQVVDNTNCPISETGNGMLAVYPSGGVLPYSYQWDDAMNQTNDTAFALDGGNYTCIIQDINGCADTVSAFVDQFAIPNMSFVTYPESCVGSMDGAIDLEVSDGDQPYTYLWSNDSTTQNISELSAGTYSVTVTDGNNCPYTDFATVDYSPALEYEYPLICEASDVQDLNFMGVSDGAWSGVGIVDTTLGLFDPLVSGVGEFEILFTSNANCADNFTMDVLVSPLPNVNFTSIIQGGCQPLNAEFFVPDAGPGASYLWNFGDGNVSNEAINGSNTYLNFGVFDVSLAITDTNFCTNSVTYEDYMTVYEKPVADFDISPEELDDIQNTAQFTSTSSAVATNFFWQFGDGATSWEQDPSHEYSSPGNFVVNLYSSSDFGCQDTATKSIRYKEVIFVYVPNSFTPNGDGRNDVFKVEVIGSVQLFSMKIFDRWGALVYSSKDINEGWVGNHLNGEYYLTSGVYSYVIEYEAWGGGLEEAIGEKFTGTITLLK